MVPMNAFCVSSRAVNKKNKRARLEKTNCRARFAFSVPKNITVVNSPHMKKYAAMEIIEEGSASRKVKLGIRSNAARDHQNKP